MGFGEPFEFCSTVLQRMLHQRGATLVDKKVENDVERGRLLRELADPALRRVNALEQVIERKFAFDWHDDLAVEDELPGLQRRDGFDDFRKISAQRLARFRLQEH